MLFFLLFMSCDSHHDQISFIDLSNMENQLKVIQNQRIYFGHRSVGNNIIDGLNQIARRYNDIHLNIVNIDSVDSFPEKFFTHNLIGINTQPMTKCNAFADILEKKMGSRVDIAFMKFCFADIKVDTEVDSVFDYYQKTISGLSAEFPNIIFVHVTVPLNSGSSGLKAWVKRLIGVADYSDASNIKKNEFNDLLLNHFDNALIFDLSRAESTHMDGSRQTFKKGDRIYYELIDAYTDTGGHLNELGKLWVAKAFINFLASIKIPVSK